MKKTTIYLTCFLISQALYANEDIAKNILGSWTLTNADNRPVKIVQAWIFLKDGVLKLSGSYVHGSKYEGTYKIDLTKNPIRIDIELDEIRDKKKIKKNKSKGIVKLEGDTLTIKVYPESEIYPVDFQLESKADVLEFKKIKTKKKITNK